MTKDEFNRELERIDRLAVAGTLHPFTIGKMRTALYNRRACEDYPLSIHPRNWYLVRPDMYQRGDKQNTALPPRREPLALKSAA